MHLSRSLWRSRVWSMGYRISLLRIPGGSVMAGKKSKGLDFFQDFWRVLYFSESYMCCGIDRRTMWGKNEWLKKKKKWANGNQRSLTFGDSNALSPQHLLSKSGRRFSNRSKNSPNGPEKRACCVNMFLLRLGTRKALSLFFELWWWC